MHSPPLVIQTRVTRIANKWHCRLYVNGDVRDEMACAYQQDTDWCCRQMLRWFKRPTGIPKAPHGRVWYRHQLK